MASILDKIVEARKERLNKSKRRIGMGDFNSFELYEAPRRPFADALRQAGEVAIIAELKKASPSKGDIRSEFDPVELAGKYVEGGASALSVLTEPDYFKGSIEYLLRVRKEVELPVLRKDFIVDPYQLEEARAYGADAALIIVKITDGSQLDELLAACRESGLQALVECYDQQDLERLEFSSFEMLGANNRDLRTFNVDLHGGVGLLQQGPDSMVKISESGIDSGRALRYLKEQGIDAALIGEYFMKQQDPGRALKELRTAAGFIGKDENRVEY